MLSISTGYPINYASIGLAEARAKLESMEALPPAIKKSLIWVDSSEVHDFQNYLCVDADPRSMDPEDPPCFEGAVKILQSEWLPGVKIRCQFEKDSFFVWPTGYAQKLPAGFYEDTRFCYDLVKPEYPTHYTSISAEEARKKLESMIDLPPAIKESLVWVDPKEQTNFYYQRMVDAHPECADPEDSFGFDVVVRKLKRKWEPGIKIYCQFEVDTCFHDDQIDPELPNLPVGYYQCTIFYFDFRLS